MNIDLYKEETAAKLRGSLLEFTKFFFMHIHNKPYKLSIPIGRESHQITLCKELTKVQRMKYAGRNLLINICPGSGKTLHICMWVAWCFSHYPDCNFLYISYSHTLASKHTALIKKIMSSRMYGYLFGIEIARDSRAKDHFSTTAGGSVAAFGSTGSITGRDAGLPGLERFSGAVIIDDAHKPGEVHSDTIRESIIENYKETISQRPRGHNVPIVFIGQRLHEADLGGFFIEGKDIKPWETVILKSLDEAGNVLCPDVYTKEYLEALRDEWSYVFFSQHQQDPVPAGNGLFRKEDIVQLDEYPNIITTFITVDTAETSKKYNDATVFSFWGVYEIETMGVKTGLVGLHWIDCIELRIEPKDLEACFMDFFRECCRFQIPPKITAIEKKSTGVTLISILEGIRGMNIRDIPRNRDSGNKSDRFIAIQPHICGKKISINKDALHKELCLNHISKITANNTHRFDDIADTLADAVSMAIIDKQFPLSNEKNDSNKKKFEFLRTDFIRRANAGTHR